MHVFIKNPTSLQTKNDQLNCFGTIIDEIKKSSNSNNNNNVKSGWNNKAI